MIQVLKNKNEWNAFLNECKNSDFYFTYDYHHFSKNDNETPILIKYSDGANEIAIPLLIRPIENSDYKDATSVYGYTGILIKRMFLNFKKQDFHEELDDFFQRNKIVSVFSRLHPYLELEESILNGLGNLTTLGKVVYIDLTDSIENQRTKFNRRLKTYLNKSRRTCEVIDGTVEKHLETFIEIYYDNMKRVDANESYFFSKKYFYDFLTCSDFRSKLKICIDKDTNEVVAGAIFTKVGNIVQYHLSGMRADYFDLYPIKLIIDEMRIEATNKGYKYLNLGGGKSSKEDSLFRFKSSFSKDFKEFKIWKHIVDPIAYKALVEEKLGTEAENETSGYFPAYRATSKVLH